MRYHGVGWGLQQVMFNMSAQGTSQTQILKNFALATLNRMVRRSQLAANSIERTQWIHGWANRILGYGFTEFDSEIKAMATEENADGTLKWPKLGIGNKALRNLF